MGYTALQKMRECNKNRFGKDMGPLETEKHFATDGCDLKSATIDILKMGL